MVTATTKPGKRNGFVEIVFTGKPSADVRSEIKACGFRYNPHDNVWWGKQSDLPARFANGPVDVDGDVRVKSAPVPGKTYALTGKTGDKCISNGNTWEESEVKPASPVVQDKVDPIKESEPVEEAAPTEEPVQDDSVQETKEDFGLTKECRWNPEHPDKILIRTNTGNEVVKCERCEGGLALVRPGKPREWTITHVRTGFGILTEMKQVSDLALAQAMYEGALGVADWNLDGSELVKVKDMRSRLVSIANQARATIEMKAQVQDAQPEPEPEVEAEPEPEPEPEVKWTKTAIRPVRTENDGIAIVKVETAPPAPVVDEAEQLRQELSSKYGEVYDTKRLQEHFRVIGFCYCIANVEEKATGLRGTMDFTNNPRFYYNFVADAGQVARPQPVVAPAPAPAPKVVPLVQSESVAMLATANKIRALMAARKATV